MLKINQAADTKADDSVELAVLLVWDWRVLQPHKGNASARERITSTTFFFICVYLSFFVKYLDKKVFSRYNLCERLSP